nr:hypothetical protein [Tanacetum cinerariifolium]
MPSGGALDFLIEVRPLGAYSPTTNVLVGPGKAFVKIELVRHPDMNVNISVACCICEILRITAPKSPYNNEQIKDFFELVVMSFEKLSSVSGGYYDKMTKVLENIMRMIVEESEKLAIELQDLLLTSIRKDNQSGSPVCWKFGQKVLMICAAKLKPIDRRSITVFDYPEIVALNCKTTSDKGVKETIPFITETSKMIDENPKIKFELPGTINMMQSKRHCRGTPMASKSVREINGKRKRNNEQAPYVEHGEILVGRKIRVWQAKDEIFFDIELYSTTFPDKLITKKESSSISSITMLQTVDRIDHPSGSGFIGINM